MDKERIKKELVEKSNAVLAKHGENEILDSVSVMNMAAKTVFLGSLKVYNTAVVPNVMNDLKKELKGYGKLTLRDERITPCCAPSYIHISFNVSVDK